MAFPTGLLVLTKPTAALYKHIPSILKEVSRHVHETLYVHLAPGITTQTGQSSAGFSQIVVPCSKEVKRFVNGFYTHAASQCTGLDVRILLSNISNHKDIHIKPYSLNRTCAVFLFDHNTDQDAKSILHYLSQNFPSPLNDTPIIRILEASTQLSDTELPGYTESEEGVCNVYDHVVLGGTFDRLHTGHKVLLGEACLVCKDKLTIGVTEPAMNQKKKLYELIEPTSKRIEFLREFLVDTKPTLDYNIVGITDPFGPSIVEEDMGCIVVSQETLKGGEAVNVKRKEKGLSKLDVNVIELVQDPHHSAEEEEKISSSSLRKRLLGTLLQPSVTKDLPNRPYILGLTGGIASGKSSVCRRLEKLGAGVVDCDKLGHIAYEPGTDAYQKMVNHYGTKVLSNNGTIDRTILGPIVFGDKRELQKLNEILWPTIAELAKQRIQTLHLQGKDVVVLDAAVLFEAGWDSLVHEVWTTFVKKEEAILRIMERNNLTEEDSIKRIKSQSTNEERISKSNVVLSTLWEYEVTQKQVEKAWHLLRQRLPAAHL